MNKWLVVLLSGVGALVVVALVMGWNLPLLDLPSHENIEAASEDDWKLIAETDRMTDDIRHKAYKTFKDGPIRTEAVTTCDKSALSIEFAFFNDNDGSGWALEKLSQTDLLSAFTERNVDSSLMALGMLAEGRHQNFVRFRRRVDWQDVRNVIRSPKYTNAITESSFKNYVFEREGRLLYEFTLEGGLSTIIEIYPDAAGFAEIAYQCGNIDYRPRSLGPDPRIADLPVMSAESARSAAIQILLGDPYGETIKEVDANIQSQSLQDDEYCETGVPSWNFDVKYALTNHGGSGLLVLDARTGDMICAGLPFLD